MPQQVAVARLPLRTRGGGDHATMGRIGPSGNGATANEPHGQRCTKQMTLTQFCAQRQAEGEAGVQARPPQAQMFDL